MKSNTNSLHPLFYSRRIAILLKLVRFNNFHTQKYLYTIYTSLALISHLLEYEFEVLHDMRPGGWHGHAFDSVD